MSNLMVSAPWRWEEKGQAVVESKDFCFFFTVEKIFL
jgi:hypothetical protein